MANGAAHDRGSGSSSDICHNCGSYAGRSGGSDSGSGDRRTIDGSGVRNNVNGGGNGSPTDRGSNSGSSGGRGSGSGGGLGQTLR